MKLKKGQQVAGFPIANCEFPPQEIRGIVCPEKFFNIKISSFTLRIFGKKVFDKNRLSEKIKLGRQVFFVPASYDAAGF